MWQRRGGENWLLKGDANTGYFHGIANGVCTKIWKRSRSYTSAASAQGITESDSIRRGIVGSYLYRNRLISFFI